MGLIKQAEEISVIFTHGESSNTLDGSTYFQDIQITQDELNGDTARLIMWNDAGENKDKVVEGWDVEIQVKWAGGALATFWKGVVNQMTPELSECNQDIITIQCIDKGTYELSGLTTTASHGFASADAGYIIEDLVDQYSGLDTTNIDVTTGTTLSVTIDVGRNLMDIIRELTPSGYTWRVDEDNKAYLIERGGVGAFTLTNLKGSNFIVDRNIQSVKNDILVKGAFIGNSTSTSQAGPPDGDWTVDNNANRRTKKFTPTGSVSKVVVSAKKNSSTYNLYLRIQPDNGAGTAPLAIANYEADLARVVIPNAQLPAAYASVGGFCNASLVDDVSDYWLIVEADGAAGALPIVGYKTVVAVDTLIFEAESQLELTSSDSDATSIAAYGTRKYTHVDRTLITQNEVDEMRAALLAAYKDISKTVSCNLENDLWDGARARLGDKVTVTLTNQNVSAEAMGLINISYRFVGGDGPWVDVSITVSTTRGALNSDDMFASMTRSIQKNSEQISTASATLSGLTESGLPEHGADKHTNRTRYVWIPAPSCAAYYNGSIDEGSELDYRPTINMDASLYYTIIEASLYRPLNYVGTPKVKAVFIDATGEPGASDTIRIDFKSESIAVGEAWTGVSSLFGTPDASETIDVGSSYQRYDSSWQDLASWNADDVMHIAIRKNYDHADDDIDAAFVGFLVSYIADQ